MTEGTEGSLKVHVKMESQKDRRDEHSLQRKEDVPRRFQCEIITYTGTSDRFYH